MFRSMFSSLSLSPTLSAVTIGVSTLYSGATSDWADAGMAKALAVTLKLAITFLAIVPGSSRVYRRPTVSVSRGVTFQSSVT